MKFLMKKPISKKDEKKASLRNKLTLPLTVLEMISKGKDVPKKDVLLALKELRSVSEKV